MSTRRAAAGLHARARAHAGAAAAREKPFEPVASGVRARTGREVRWEEDAAAREQSLAQVRALLQRPLSSARRCRSRC